MELFGIVLAIPVAFVASAIYTQVLRVALRRWSVGGVVLRSSVVILLTLVLEWCALAAYGPIRLQEATAGAFFGVHLALFFLSVPALASILVVKRGETWLGSWVVVGGLCAVLALAVVLTQYGVSEALFGIG